MENVKSLTFIYSTLNLSEVFQDFLITNYALSDLTLGTDGAVLSVFITFAISRYDSEQKTLPH